MQNNYSTGWKLVHRGYIVILLILAGLFPYLAFGLVPFVSTEDTPEIDKVAVTVANDAKPMTEADTKLVEFDKDAKWCIFCHTLKKGETHKTGPNLYGFFGRPVASQPQFFYSAAFKKKKAEGMVWDDKTLDAFLTDPPHYIPGTRMPLRGRIKDPEMRKRVINYIKLQTADVKAP